MTNIHTHTHTHTLSLSLSLSHDTHCLSLESEVRVTQPNSEIRSVIKALWQPRSLYYLEKAGLNLLSRDIDRERRNIFFHMSGSQESENNHI